MATCLWAWNWVSCKSQFEFQFWMAHCRQTIFHFLKQKLAKEFDQSNLWLAWQKKLVVIAVLQCNFQYALASRNGFVLLGEFDDAVLPSKMLSVFEQQTQAKKHKLAIDTCITLNTKEFLCQNKKWIFCQCVDCEEKVCVSSAIVNCAEGASWSIGSFHIFGLVPGQCLQEKVSHNCTRCLCLGLVQPFPANQSMSAGISWRFPFCTECVRQLCACWLLHKCCQSVEWFTPQLSGWALVPCWSVVAQCTGGSCLGFFPLIASDSMSLIHTITLLLCVWIDTPTYSSESVWWCITCFLVCAKKSWRPFFHDCFKKF